MSNCSLCRLTWGEGLCSGHQGGAVMGQLQ